MDILHRSILWARIGRAAGPANTMAIGFNPALMRAEILMGDILTKEAAELKEVSVRRIQQLIEDGTLKAERRGRDYLIKRRDLDKVKVYGKAGRPFKEDSATPGTVKKGLHREKVTPSPRPRRRVR